ncbi:MAG TPA: hypothetical protein VGN74_08330 [Brevundimonas sp.]|jgi:hypothetical protein|uniref:hypothetical protein n=1 Tax=Brevundimonas sp. TaxID=1871086 RepID=UPI002E0F4748|nr:hypothetical protein [Brevundimonas sp.]
MACGAALASTLLLTLSGPAAIAAPVAAPVAAPATLDAALAAEPLFRDIVTRAGTLKARVEAWTADGAGLAPAFPEGEAFRALKAEAEALAALDLQAHHWLAARDADGDLKCILRGIAEDLPVRLAAVETSQGPARAEALAELAHLLDDNAAVILAPPQPAT